MTISRLSALALAGALSLSCATLGEAAPATAPALGAVRRIAVVHVRPDPGAARVKDPLDALAESLAARGYETRIEEAGPGASEALRAVERLHARLEGWVAATPTRGRSGRRAEALGAEAAKVVRDLGTDAVAIYHRLDDRSFAPLPEPPLGGSAFPRRYEPSRRPLGALSIVDREGNAASVAWGGAGAELDPSAPVNAAEAIDLILRALTGEPEEG
jgi:hypothetical protein